MFDHRSRRFRQHSLAAPATGLFAPLHQFASTAANRLPFLANDLTSLKSNGPAQSKRLSWTLVSLAAGQNVAFFRILGDGPGSSNGMPKVVCAADDREWSVDLRTVTVSPSRSAREVGARRAHIHRPALEDVRRVNESFSQRDDAPGIREKQFIWAVPAMYPFGFVKKKAILQPLSLPENMRLT